MAENGHGLETLDQARYSLAQKLEALALLSPLVIGCADGTVLAKKSAERERPTACIQACGEVAVGSSLDVPFEVGHKRVVVSPKHDLPKPHPTVKSPELLTTVAPIPNRSGSKQKKPAPVLVAHPRFASAGAFVPFGKKPVHKQGVFEDVSWPQCREHRPKLAKSNLPSKLDGVIVGVNDGEPTTTNRCLPGMLRWANKAGKTELYVNAYNSGAANPRAHGWRIAKNDIEKRLLPAIKEAGLNVKPTDYDIVWLDVEGRWDGSRTENRKMLEGMAAYFKHYGLKVGLYSVNSVTSHRQENTSYFHRIVGKVPESSNLSGLPSWLAQGDGYKGAIEACHYLPLTPNSKVVMTQYTKHNLDHEYICS